MSVFGVIAFLFGVLGVILTVKQSILCWPSALISVVASSVDFYYARLFGDMSLQVFYFFAGVYGWIYWQRSRKESFVVQKTDRKAVPFLLIITGVQAILYYFLLKRFNGERPVLDATLTAASLTTTYMMTKKWVENWIIWVAIDSFYVILYALTNLWLYAALYMLFAAMAYYGWLKWRRETYVGSL